MSRDKQRLPLCRLSPNLVTYLHEVASMPLGEVSRESCSVSPSSYEPAADTAS